MNPLYFKSGKYNNNNKKKKSTVCARRGIPRTSCAVFAVRTTPLLLNCRAYRKNKI
jgi:hypothetical protein